MAELYQNIDFDILWKKIHNQASAEEELILNNWLGTHPSHRKFYENAVRFYAHGTQFANSPADLKKTFRIIRRKAGIHTPALNTTIIAITSIAASILLLLYFQFYNPTTPKETISNEIQMTEVMQSIVPGGPKAMLILADGSEHDLTSGTQSTIIATDGTKIINTGNKLEYTEKKEQPEEVKYNTLKIPRGGEYFLILSDSTKVWLNSETSLRFPVQFAGNARSVELTGEAYFEVTKNKDVPFVVSSGNQEVKVLGTQFNISSYADDQQIRTTLVEGRVELSLTDNPESKLVLNPNEQSIVGQNTNQISKRSVDASQYVAWKDGRFVFKDQMLGNIMKTLSKWYNVDVNFSREDLKQLKFTGNLERYADFSDILKKIERTNEVKFAITNNQITIN